MDTSILNADMLSQMLEGTLLTVKLFVLTMALSLPIGLCITFIVTSTNRLIRTIANFYILIMRGTPLLLQMFFIYFGLPNIPVIGEYLLLDRFEACVIAFVLNYAAYYAEIFRGGLLAIDPGQYEASKVLGMTTMQSRLKVVLPQMFRVTLPGVGNEAIVLVKDTALISVLAQPELLHVTQGLVNAKANVTPFFVAAIFYLVLSYLLTILFRKLEAKYKI